MGYRVNAVLLDTHIVLWWLQGGQRLSVNAKNAIRTSAVRVLVSAASAWEIAIKYRAGKLDAARPLIDRFQNALAEEHFEELPISVRNAIQAGLLKGAHKDPFDRLLIAQAQEQRIPVISTDKCFDDYGIARIW